VHCGCSWHSSLTECPSSTHMRGLASLKEFESSIQFLRTVTRRFQHPNLGSWKALQGMPRRPPLVVLCGVPGCGKTTIARILSGKIPGAVHIQTDTVRQMIVRPKYNASESEFVYESCLRVAREALKRGRPVVLDGVFARSEHRTRALTLLRGFYGRSLVVYVACSIDTAKRRNASRKSAVPDERFNAIYTHFEAPTKTLKVDTDAHSAEENASLILAAIGR